MTQDKRETALEIVGEFALKSISKTTGFIFPWEGHPTRPTFLLSLVILDNLARINELVIQALKDCSYFTTLSDHTNVGQASGLYTLQLHVV